MIRIPPRGTKADLLLFSYQAVFIFAVVFVIFVAREPVDLEPRPLYFRRRLRHLRRTGPPPNHQILFAKLLSKHLQTISKPRDSIRKAALTTSKASPNLLSLTYICPDECRPRYQSLTAFLGNADPEKTVPGANVDLIEK